MQHPPFWPGFPTLPPCCLHSSLCSCSSCGYPAGCPLGLRTGLRSSPCRYLQGALPLLRRHLSIALVPEKPLKIASCPCLAPCTTHSALFFFWLFIILHLYLTCKYNYIYMFIYLCSVCPARLSSMRAGTFLFRAVTLLTADYSNALAPRGHVANICWIN